MALATSGLRKLNFKSYAIFDLETNGLPSHYFNKVAITEISIYGISVKDLTNTKTKNVERDLSSAGAAVPKKPRILHKLNLLFNPQMRIDPTAEQITGLDNYMLEYESSFDKNAGNIILNFLMHLQQPVCLIAHNGWNFDFPILKKMLEKVQMQLPDSTFCVDSFAAFKEIDQLCAMKEQEKLNALKEAKVTKTALEDVIVIESDSEELPNKAETNIGDEKNLNSLNVAEETKTTTEDVIVIEAETKTQLSTGECDNEKQTSETNIYEVLEENDKINWRAINETTPKRPILKRKQIFNNANDINRKPLKSQRRIFSSNSHVNNQTDKLCRPRGFFKLTAIYERIFGETFPDAHHAEADVDALMKIIQYYGSDFVEYAETRARPFSDVINVGASWSNF